MILSVVSECLIGSRCSMPQSDVELKISVLISVDAALGNTKMAINVVKSVRVMKWSPVKCLHHQLCM